MEHPQKEERRSLGHKSSNLDDKEDILEHVCQMSIWFPGNFYSLVEKGIGKLRQVNPRKESYFLRAIVASRVYISILSFCHLSIELAILIVHNNFVIDNNFSIEY